MAVNVARVQWKVKNHMWWDWRNRYQIKQGLGYLSLVGTEGLDQSMLAEMEDNRKRHLPLLELTGLADGLDDNIEKKVGLEATF